MLGTRAKPRCLPALSADSSIAIRRSHPRGLGHGRGAKTQAPWRPRSISGPQCLKPAPAYKARAAEEQPRDPEHRTSAASRSWEPTATQRCRGVQLKQWIWPGATGPGEKAAPCRASHFYLFGQPPG